MQIEIFMKKEVVSISAVSFVAGLTIGMIAQISKLWLLDLNNML